MKLLIADNAERLEKLRSTELRLDREWGISVSEIIFDNRKEDATHVEDIIVACRDINILLIHFGSIPREKAAKILHQIKLAVRAKIVVISASRILFEEADAVMQTPFFSEQLVDIINKFNS